MTEEEKAEQDRAWSRRVAGIPIGSLIVANPPILSLTAEQIARCTDIVAEEIFLRLIIGDRP